MNANGIHRRAAAQSVKSAGQAWIVHAGDGKEADRAPSTVAPPRVVMTGRWLRSRLIGYRRFALQNRVWLLPRGSIDRQSPSTARPADSMMYGGPGRHGLAP